MSLRGVKKVVAEVNASLRFYKFIGGVKPNYTGAILDTSVSKDISFLNQQLSALSLSKIQVEKLPFTSAILDIPIKKSIIEPNENIKINFELPIKNSTNAALDLPLYIEKEIAEPGKVISKKAEHILRIRKRKMRKHKRRKFMRKYKVELAYRKLQRNLAKEEKFQNFLRSILNDKDEFSAEKYVSDMLETANWKKPVTTARGMLAPQWVIQDYLKKKEEDRILKERIKECLK